MGENTSKAFTSQNMKNITGKWRKGEEAAKVTYNYVQKNMQEINYYAFLLGNIIKSAIAMIPTSIRDTIVHNEQTKKEQKLLSVQKLLAIMQMEDFQTFAEEMIKLVKRHHNLFEGLTMADGKSLMKIFREIREDDFKTFMAKVKGNIANMGEEQNYENKTATDLLKDVFVGENSISKLQNDIRRLMEKIGQLNENIISQQMKEALGEEKIEQFRQMLETISK